MFGHHSDNSGSSSSPTPAVCPAIPTPVSDADEVYPGWTVDSILRVICFVCGGLTALISLLLFFLHAFNMRNPPEQIKIMRIILMLPIFAGLSILSIVVGQSAVYVEPWKDFYEGLALSGFFTLVCTYVGPDRLAHQEYFSNLQVGKKDGAEHDDGWKFFNRAALFVNQYVVVQLVVCIATDITQAAGVYCLQSNGIHFAHIWLKIISAISTTVAVLACIRVTMRLRKEIPERPIVKQLLSFKLLIGINWLQGIVFSLAAAHVTPTATLSYNDVTVGLPNALLCVEMVFFAAFFHVAYSHRAYRDALVVPYYGLSPEDTRAHAVSFHVGPLAAIAHALNPIGVPLAIREILRARKSLGEEGQTLREAQVHQPYSAVHARSRSSSPDPKAYMGRGM